jgi:hypothetical protein
MLIFNFLILLTFAQNLVTTPEVEPNSLYQKIYVQTDRDVYFLGETIWLSGYLLDGQTHRPVKDDQNLHVDLIDSAGHIVKSVIFLARQGFSEGSILLTDSLLPGKFVLRAYTSYLRNFGNESFFYKPLTIVKTQTSSETFIKCPVRKERTLDDKPIVHNIPRRRIHC